MFIRGIILLGSICVVSNQGRWEVKEETEAKKGKKEGLPKVLQQARDKARKLLCSAHNCGLTLEGLLGYL